ncbi:hypothetical protein MWU75_07195 [Ornithinimicrobium sp. F0845]|uniref:hypothetical protein n=1 Tax=Ornithinimicrobium sp. F0845 TaxID=2926412 RepID=UPI001FF2EC78|nr:hypothetical protein [Ornithinimicrobium sp. F0845]MCK0111920.1 hypothetical protein [Ornithinimicrobium sp. F0845]
MHTAFVDCDSNADVEEAIVRGLRAVDAPEDTEVRVCGDIAREISQFQGLPYSADRPGGIVGGRTFLSPDGGPVIFLNNASLADEDVNGSSTPLEAVERLAAHEGCHASMDARGESLNEADLVGLTVPASLMRQMTDISIAEFRAESAVRTAGYSGPRHNDDRLAGVVAAMFEVLTDPASADPETFARAAAPICQSYIVDLSIAAAWGEALGPPELSPLFDRGNSSRLYQALQDLPPADVNMDQFNKVLDSLTPLVVGAVLDVGFEWTDGPYGGWGAYRRASDELLDRRVAITSRWYQTQMSD